MFSNEAAELSLDFPNIRALDAVRADKVESRFLIGTSSSPSPTSVDSSSYLQMIRFHSDRNQLGLDATLSHPTGPVRNICTSPHDKSLVLTIAQDQPSATMWKIPNDVIERSSNAYLDDSVNDDEENVDDDDMDNIHHPNSKITSDMEQVSQLTHDSENNNNSNNNKSNYIVDIAWRGAAWDDDDHAYGTPIHRDVCTLDQGGRLTQWDWTADASPVDSRTMSGIAPWNVPPRMAWDPHSVDTMAVSSGTGVEIIDWRTQQTKDNVGSALVSSSCHRYAVTDLEYNPNKPHVLTTCGQDGRVKFWDLRCATQQHHHHNSTEGRTTNSGNGRRRPLLMVARGGHSHWVSRVSYNPCHDQLVVSAGTDGVVQLWRMSTISSAPLLVVTPTAASANNATTSDEALNASVARYEHFDSVYALSWSAADAWIYMTAGYDGKVVLHHVPSKEKYKILL